MRTWGIYRPTLACQRVWPAGQPHDSPCPKQIVPRRRDCHSPRPRLLLQAAADLLVISRSPTCHQPSSPAATALILSPTSIDPLSYTRRWSAPIRRFRATSARGSLRVVRRGRFAFWKRDLLSPLAYFWQASNRILTCLQLPIHREALVMAEQRPLLRAPKAALKGRTPRRGSQSPEYQGLSRSSPRSAQSALSPSPPLLSSHISCPSQPSRGCQDS